MIKAILKILLWTVLALVIVLAIAYWTAPSWAPTQIQKLLPNSIQLSDIQLKHPGLSSTTVDQLTIRIGEDDPYHLDLTQVEIHYSLWRGRLTSISAKSAQLILPQKSNTGNASQPLKTIPLPQLPVPTIKVQQLAVEGLALQNIIINDLTIREQPESLAITAAIDFLDYQFALYGKIKRHDASLAAINADIQQGRSKIQLQASPVNHKHWAIKATGNIVTQDYYPKPGLGALELTIDGTINVSANPFTLALSETSQLKTSLDIDKFGLQQQLLELLNRNHIDSNITQQNPLHQVSLNPIQAILSYDNHKNELQLESGAIMVKTTNPALSTESELSTLQLNLNQSLTSPQQTIAAQSHIILNDIAAIFQTDANRVNIKKLNLNAQVKLRLNSGNLTIASPKTSLSTDTINYLGQHSTATISPTQWSLSGDSQFNLIDKQPLTHQWALSTHKTNGTLNLSQEQFKADAISTNFKFSSSTPTSQSQPQLTGSYTIGQLNLQQQPLQLSSIKGNLSLTPKSSSSNKSQARGTHTSDSYNTTLNGALTFANATYNSQQIGINNLSGQLNWAKQPQRFVADGKLFHQKSAIPFTYQFDLNHSRHNLKIDQSSLPVSTLTSWLTILKDYPELSFNSGQLEVNSLDGDPVGLLFDGHIQLDNFNLNYDEFYVKNWTIEDSLSPDSKLGGTLKSHIERIELATNIAVTDISFLMPHTINSLVITNLKGHLLQGIIEIPSLAINKQGISPFITHLKGIDIGALLKALNSEKLVLQGRFDFTLPLSISSEGQEINNGAFKALDEGVISLKSNKGKEANIAFQALENFHYTEFSGTINYDLTGNYVISLNVLGSNPNLYSGFPIKLDLTLRGKLPALLYSMLVTGDMAKPILDDLEQKQLLNIQP